MATENNTHEIAPEINYETYNSDLEDQKEAINKKIEEHERKLIDLEIKEKMLNNIITRTNATLENIDPNNFKWIGQTQTNLMKQIENLGLLKDIIIKYEDMIFKYRKVLLEITEKSLSNRIKISTLLQEEVKEEDNINTVLANIQEIMNQQTVGEGLDGDNLIQSKTEDSGALLLQQLESELTQENY